MLERAVDEAAERVGAGGPVAGRRRRTPARAAARPAAARAAAPGRGGGRAARCRCVPSRCGRSSELAARGGSASLDIGGGVRVVSEYGVLRFQRRDRRTSRPARRPCRCPGRCRFGDWEVLCELEPARRAARWARLADEPLLDAAQAGRRAHRSRLARRRSHAAARPRRHASPSRTCSPTRKVPRSLRHQPAGGRIRRRDRLGRRRRALGSSSRSRARTTRARLRADAVPRHPPTPSAPRTLHCRRGTATRDSGQRAVGEVIVAPDELQRRVAELAAEITHDYAGRELFMMGVLKGAVFFVADLMRADRSSLRARLHGRLELRLADRLLRAWSGSSRTSTRRSRAATC